VEADYLDAGGVPIFVRRWHGESGRPILFWHGGGGASSEVPELAPALAAAGYSVFAPDAPGYGRSPPLQAGGYGPSAQAELAVAVMDALAIAPVVWIGSSWGATIGIHAAARSAAYLDALALLDGGYIDARDDPDFDPSSDLAARTAELRARMEAGESWDAPPEVVAAVMQAADDEPAWIELPALHTSGIRVLLLRAIQPPEYEAVRTRALARFRAALPGAEVVDLAAGHALLADAGPQVRQILMDWLDGLA
jgi:pimeloyl-ACP methyl ester carboxylesterase